MTESGNRHQFRSNQDCKESFMVEEYFEYDVGLSFAGEQRDYVGQVANELKVRGIRVFFDDYERETLWGKDLYAHLSEVYQHMCRFCVIFVSEEYAAKVWPTRERESAQARALKEKGNIFSLRDLTAPPYQACWTPSATLI